MIALHVWGEIASNVLVQSLPSDYFAFVVDSYSEKDYERDRVVEHGIIVCEDICEDKFRGVGNRTKFIRPYYPGKEDDPSSIYWRGSIQRHVINRFASSFDCKVKYVDKEGFGFIRLGEDFQYPEILAGILKFVKSEDEVVNFAHSKPAKESAPKWNNPASNSKKQSGRQKLIDAAPVESKPRKAKSTTKTVKVKDSDGFIRPQKIKVPARRESAKPLDEKDSEVTEQ